MQTKPNPLMIVASSLVQQTIMIDDYARAVGHLLYLAARRDEHSFAAATVLLSFVDDVHCSISPLDLIKCDEETFRCAIICLRGAYELKKQPHDLYKNGIEVFEQLRQQWIETINAEIEAVFSISQIH